MYKLIEFLRRTYVVALFVVLETAAIGYYARSSDYTQARLMTASNSVVGGLHGVIADVRGYFHLNRENRLLLDRVAALEEQVVHYRQLQREAGRDTLLDSLHAPYRMMTARVISNSINKSHNFITIDRGERDGVAEGMGVLSPEGAMVGYVTALSDRHAVVLSILNTSFKASGRLLGGGDYYGSIWWDGGDRYHVRMKEFSKYALVERGDTVVSTGFSQYFPPDVPIGYVEEHTLSEDQMAYQVEIRLAVDVSQLIDVILVDNKEREDVLRLQNEMNRHNRGE